MSFTLAVLVAPVVAGAFWGVAVGLLLVLAALPFVTFAASHGKGDGLPAIPGLFVSAGFGVFFSAGIVAWALDRRQTTAGVARAAGSEFVLGLMAAATAIVIAFVVGERWRFAPARPRAATRLGEVFALSQVLFGLAGAGAVLTVHNLNGWRGAVESLTPHDKVELLRVSGTLGLSLWSIFALPALIALGIVALDGVRNRSVRLTAFGELALLSYLCVNLFGSRLVLTLGAIGTLAARYAVHGGRVRLRTLLIGVATLLLVSGFVLAKRSSSSTQESAFPQSQLQALGYGVFDVSIAALMERRQLGAQFRSPARAQSILASALPLVGRRSAALGSERVDVITVRAVGRAGQANSTGFPPSLPTFALVAFGPIFSILLALLGGLAVGALSQSLRVRSGALGGFFFGLWSAFVFNDFKGGDFLLDFVTEAKRWLYLGVAIVLVRMLTEWRAA